MNRTNVSRRAFIRASSAAGAGWLILRSGTFASAASPSNTLNVALIGAGGRATAHFEALRAENVVALCDVDANALSSAARHFPRARHYDDWRRCLEQKDIDAVVCSTTDHTHAFVAQWAMNRGKHVYLEKPIAISVEEARLLRATYLGNRHKLATQVGTQRHALGNFQRVRELIRDGAIGRLQDVHVWLNDAFTRSGYLPAAGAPPHSLRWDLWLGPASGDHPYNPGYFAGDRPGFNCGNWNKFWDFGTGEVGNWGSHTMDLAWQAIEGDLPTHAEAIGDPFHPEVAPSKLVMTFTLPPNSWRDAIRLRWYQGGGLPNAPRPFVDLSKIKHGVLFKGDKGAVVADFNSRLIIPAGDSSDMTHYRRRETADILPPHPHFQRQWIEACKGSLRTSCDFDYSGRIMETLLVGLAAWRAGGNVIYDGGTGQAVGSPAAAEFFRRSYRAGWPLNG